MAPAPVSPEELLQSTTELSFHLSLLIAIDDIKYVACCSGWQDKESVDPLGIHISTLHSRNLWCESWMSHGLVKVTKNSERILRKKIISDFSTKLEGNMMYLYASYIKIGDLCIKSSKHKIPFDHEVLLFISKIHFILVQLFFPWSRSSSFHLQGIWTVNSQN